MKSRYSQLCRVVEHKGYSQLCQAVEHKVKDTIKRFKLLSTNDKIAVAVSGGKDSQSVLYILHKLGYNVEGIAIDEGIAGYRNKTLDDLHELCAKYDIKYKIYSFKEEFGKSLDEHVKEGKKACRVCGVLRRHLLNLAARDYIKLATGHNIDDECQSIIMNLLKGNSFLSAKLGPSSGIKNRKGFVQRVKPLYFCKEKDIAAYAYMMGFPVRFAECPFSAGTFRSEVRDELNDIESLRPGTKMALIENFLSLKLKDIYSDSPFPRICRECGNPASKTLCKACEILND